VGLETPTGGAYSPKQIERPGIGTALRCLWRRQVNHPKGIEMNVLILALDGVPTEMPDADVLVVAPALNSRLRHWVSDEDAARRRAEHRVAAFVEHLERRGIHAQGRVGDADPLLAIADALSVFPADEIVITAENSSRLVERLAARA
jgi:nucleotide-binding universal stress UspA family protein